MLPIRESALSPPSSVCDPASRGPRSWRGRVNEAAPSQREEGSGSAGQMGQDLPQKRGGISPRIKDGWGWGERGYTEAEGWYCMERVKRPRMNDRIGGGGRWDENRVDYLLEKGKEKVWTGCHDREAPLK